MPNRILRDYTDSLLFEKISAEAERLFVRLLAKVDDFGRFHANPKLVKAACFPLAEDLRANTVAAWLTELSARQIVFCYKSGSGNYLAIRKFRQRVRADISKFPPPDGEKPDWYPPDDGHMTVICQSNDGHPRPKADAKTKSETHSEGPAAGSVTDPPPDPALAPPQDPDPPPESGVDTPHQPPPDLHPILELYVRRDAPSQCLEAIQSSILRGATAAEIFENTQRCAKLLRGREANRFTPTAKAFFELEKWRSPEAFEMREDAPKRSTIPSGI